MRQIHWPIIALATIFSQPAMAQDIRGILQAAAQTMGGTDLETIEYAGTGWYGQVGQNAAYLDDWPRFEIVDYSRVIDYDAGTSREDLTRQRGAYPNVGGGAPFAGQQVITELLDGEHAWNLAGDRAVPQNRGHLDGVSAADFRRLDVMLTPHGFLKAALEASDAEAITIPLAGPSQEDLSQNGQIVTMIAFTALGKYRVIGAINDRNLVELVQTWVPNPVYGDMLFESRYRHYEDFDGVMFPTIIHEHQGDPVINRGHNSMELWITDVRKNVNAPDIVAPDGVRNASAPLVRAESQEVADGVWRIAGGSHHSVLVEFDEFAVVIEAPLNEARSLAVIEEVDRLVPGKPIRYVVSSHHHFDHSGGLRTYVAQGATVLAHEAATDYFREILLRPTPRTLVPDRFAAFYPMYRASRTPTPIETFNLKYTVTDGDQILELYPIAGLAHANTMIIAYLPESGIVINADMFVPGAPGASYPEFRLANMRVLAANIERLGLDVERHLGLHGQVVSHEDFLRAIE